MRSFVPIVVQALAISAVTVLVSSSVHGGELLLTLKRTMHEPIDRVFHQRRPPVAKDSAIERLAQEIDWLEAYIDTHGSIVAKQPNIWGEARLTRHRDEFERQMAAELTAFESRMNASLRRSDQAYLGMALALQAATSGGTLPKPGDTETVASMVDESNKAIFRQGAFGLSGSAFPTKEGKEDNQISLEPTVHLDQMARYLNHLHHLRRLNEGDDTADAPGYSLNLVRIPVSILPGKMTRTGYGAEITVTAEPHLSLELLPVTFRSLVINDVIDQAALAITQYLNSQEGQDRMKQLEQRRHDLQNQRQKRQELEQQRQDLQGQKQELMSLLPEGPVREKMMQQDAHQEPPDGVSPEFSTRWKSATQDIEEITRDIDKSIQHIKGIIGDISGKRELAAQEFQRNAAAPTVSVSRSRLARLAFPPSQILDVYGENLVTDVVFHLYQAFEHDIINGQYVHITDVESYLDAELQAAYDLLSLPEVPGAQVQDYGNPEVWNFCRGLTWAVRTRQADQLAHVRRDFLEVMKGQYEPINGATAEEAPNAATRHLAFAWAILVESALLNDRLIQDMREAGAAKGYFSLPDQPLDFYGSNPVMEARHAFNRYVECRWPVHVFALDPVTQDQNVADEFSRRREMQLALALAFAGGKISAQTMSRYVRRLEWDMATIALNRTIIGFSHGEDTFGWRFYPRFQTPPIKGNLATFGEALFGGPTRDDDIKHRQLEPGMRECTAIVLMPSFVPYCRFDTRTNWFRLTNPKQTELSMRDSVKLSRSVTAMRQSAEYCGSCAHLYREGETDRLLRRVQQLECELPLQTMMAQIPYENTLGGFQMFNTGITDLGPELRGWYGAPALDHHGSTTMFLVGDHFSVHGTRLIAGGQSIGFRMISRQLLEAHFPAGLRAITPPDLQGKSYDAFVDVHVASPYGVSNHMLLPVMRADAVARPTYRMQAATLTLYFTRNKADKSITIKPFFEARPQQIVILAPEGANTESNFAFGATHNGKSLGSFSVSAKLNLRSGEYVIAGTSLVDFVGAEEDATSLAKSVKEHLEELIEANGRLESWYELRFTAHLQNDQRRPVPVTNHLTLILEQIPTE